MDATTGDQGEPIIDLTHLDFSDFQAVNGTDSTSSTNFIVRYFTWVFKTTGTVTLLQAIAWGMLGVYLLARIYVPLLHSLNRKLLARLTGSAVAAEAKENSTTTTRTSSGSDVVVVEYKGIAFFNSKFMTTMLNAAHALFDSVHIMWLVLLGIISVPFYRYEDSLQWNCFYGWAFLGIMTLFMTIEPLNKMREKFRYFSYFYFLYFANGIATMANIGYVYYDLTTFSWPYLVVHFAPPVFIFIYCMVKSHTIPDDYNPINHPSLFWYTFVMCISNLFEIPYLYFVDVNVVYDRPMLEMHILGAIFPPLLNIILSMVLLFSKTVHTILFGVQPKAVPAVMTSSSTAPVDSAKQSKAKRSNK